jgi:hypothetical protein
MGKGHLSAFCGNYRVTLNEERTSSTKTKTTAEPLQMKDLTKAAMDYEGETTAINLTNIK